MVRVVVKLLEREKIGNSRWSHLKPQRKWLSSEECPYLCLLDGCHWQTLRSLLNFQGWRAFTWSRCQGCGKPHSKDALELAEYARSNSLLEASIGMATINSLIDIDESKCIEKNAFEILVETSKGTGLDVESCIEIFKEAEFDLIQGPSIIYSEKGFGKNS